MDRASRSFARRAAALIATALVALAAVVLWRLNGDAVTDEARAPAAATGVPPSEQPLRYEVEYPLIRYADRELDNRVTRVAARIAAGEVRLEGGSMRDSLAPLLAALDIGVESQVLVFSKTSLQTGGISAATPRAIYFNDDTYVAAVQGTDSFEIATFDPAVGPVFYTLAADGAATPKLERQLERCLRCHDAYSLSGGGVPRFITGSGYTDAAGRLVAHEGWILTSDRTPLRSRWGGWYVSGFHGEQVHLGNVIIGDLSDFERLEELRVGNIESLDGVVDTSAYLTNRSDIVALMVLEHQVRVQNAITRAGWDTQKVLAEAGDTEEERAPSVTARLAAINEPLVEALLLVGEASLTDGIEGTSGFAEAFESRGPHDSQGRSLRDLDLTRRLFRYPLSYLIGSEGFAALPEASKDYVYGRLGEILGGSDQTGKYAHLSADDRTAILEILRATSPAVHAAVAAAR